MPTVLLHNHDYPHGLQDVLRLFYGPKMEILEGEIRVGSDLEVLIRSFYRQDSYVETMLQTDHCQGACERIVSDEEILDETELKRELKRQLYYILSSYTGIRYPWGSLTGIRPTFVAKQYIDRLGMDGAKRVLEEHFFVSEPKADLAITTALTEYALLDRFPEDDLALYIGIPFCPTRCSYCSFTTIEGIGRPEAEMDAYLDALIHELRLYWSNDAVRSGERGLIRAFYMGGGTPTALTAKQLERLFKALDELDLPWAEDCERTIEAGRPDTIDLAKLRVIKRAGFTRLSINPQSMRDDTLRSIGRSHLSEDVRTSFRLARSLGFDDINMDLIAGLGTETPGDFAYSLAEVLALEPDSVSVHNLAVKRSSRMHRRMVEARLRSERLGLDDDGSIDIYKPDENVASMLLAARSTLEAAGYEPYYLYRSKDGLGSLENTAFAKPGKTCLYNVSMMADNRTILSFGAGSITKIYRDGKLHRAPNLRNILEYQTRIEEMVSRKLQLS